MCERKHNKFKPTPLNSSMEGEQLDYNQVYGDFNLKLREIEERQRNLKDRLVLISRNLIETKEETSKKFLEIKRDIEILNQSMKKVKAFLEMISEELSKFARREDLEILSKQAKMFQP